MHIHIHLSAISGWNCKLENRTTRKKKNGGRARTDNKHGGEGRVTKPWEKPVEEAAGSITSRCSGNEPALLPIVIGEKRESSGNRA